MSGHRPWLVAPDRKDLVFVPGVAQPMRCGSAERARLIAAAPMLLEALNRCRFDSLNMSLADLDFCRAAIAAATGETK